MNLALAFKAEVMLGLQLVTRHRAPRLVLLLVASLVLVMVSGDTDASSEARQRTILLIAAILGAVAGSRLLARGGPLAAARRAATSSLVPVTGRLAGCLLPVAAVLVSVCPAVIGSSAITGTILAALLLGATSAALAMAVAPVLGASSAAALGFAAALFGGVRPSAVAALLAPWPLAQTPMVLLWNSLPLAWRPARWLTDGPDRGDPWVLLAWLVVAVWVGAWAIERFPEHGGHREAS